MWELDPRFHTPGWAERRLKELRQEKESIGYWDSSDKPNAQPRVVASHQWGPTLDDTAYVNISARDFEHIQQIVREELERVFSEMHAKMGLPVEV